MAAVLVAAAPLGAQQGRVIDLTLETAVGLGMQDSYRVRRLRLDIDRTRSLLQAQRAGLKSRVYMSFAAPQFGRISQSKWNSTLQRDEMVRQQSQLWQLDFSVEQPVILLGYPTNGYLSLNNRVYRYTQRVQDAEGDDVTYYNRYFLRYSQPFFQPNWLRSNLENAELDLRRAELNYQTDAVNIIDAIADEYHGLFRLAYRQGSYAELVASLQRASEVAREKAHREPRRVIEANQAQVALANARERLQQARSDFRLASSRMKQRLRLSPADSLVVRPDLQVTPFRVDVERAIEYGVTLRPQLRTLDIQRRKDEIDLQNTRGSNSFQLNLELTYGREMQDPVLRQLMDDPSNSYTVGVRGSLPIWDWGAKRARVEAERLSLARTELSLQETREQIEMEIRNLARNVGEFQQRAENMEENLTLARNVAAMSLKQYEEGAITMLDLLQAIERQEDTSGNFIDAFLGYRKAVIDLQQLTYYDFEHQVPLLERLGIAAAEAPAGGEE